MTTTVIGKWSIWLTLRQSNMAMENPVYCKWKFTSIESINGDFQLPWLMTPEETGWIFPVGFQQQEHSQICQGSSWLGEPCCVAACGKTAGMKIWGCHQCHLYGRNLHENPIPPPLQSHHGGWGWNHNIWDHRMGMFDMRGWDYIKPNALKLSFGDGFVTYFLQVMRDCALLGLPL